MGDWKSWPPQPWSLVPVADPLAVKGLWSVEIGGVVGSSQEDSPH